MKQINNGFKDYYYLKEDGTIFNYASNKTINADKTHSFYLKTKDNSSKKIALKTLFKKVYGKTFCIDNITDLENEEWKEIADTNGLYKISNKGRIKSYQGYTATILKPYINQCGYLRVDILVDGSRQCKLVSRLVAAAFLPFPKDIDYQLHHKDFNKQNNSAENLEWLTPKQHNLIHRKKVRENVSSKSKNSFY